VTNISWNSLIEENRIAAPDLRQDSFLVAFIIQALNQPYKRSQKVPKSPKKSQKVPKSPKKSQKVPKSPKKSQLKIAHMQLTKILAKTFFIPFQ
jgi:hypothetical protein